MANAAYHAKLPTRVFLRRLSYNMLCGFVIICSSLFLGMLGYRYFENFTWIDAYENAAMILSGMGPVKEMKTNVGKIFAGTYALFSGIVFLVVIAIIFAPVIHRFFHQFHIAENE